MISQSKKIFTYSPEDIEKLIVEDVKRQLDTKELPKFGKVHFNVDGKEDPTDWRAEYPMSYVLTKATIEVTE
jgi:hypothetical protein